MLLTTRTFPPLPLIDAVSKFFAGAALLLYAVIATAERPPKFDDSSLSGSYALVGAGGQHVAASVGIATFNGEGSANRTLILNEPDPSGAGRITLRVAGEGQYSVGVNGMGTATYVTRFPDGREFTFDFDFVITQARRAGGSGVMLATRLHMVQRETGVAAPLVQFQLNRLHD